MSAERLILRDNVGNSIEVKYTDNGIYLKIKDMNEIKNAYLDRGHAHLLMLYLQEHLKHISNYEKAIWNAAIEEAAKVANDERHNLGMIDQILKLKK